MTLAIGHKIRLSMRGVVGIARSLRIYYGSRGRMRRMEGLYRPFVKPGDLVFDIGAHVGDRISAFRKLGARIVALEPQPAAFRSLKLIYGTAPEVTLIQAAASHVEGSIELHVNLANPTISTASPEFIEATRNAPGWEGQRWDEQITVPAVTLDALVAEHGVPAFTKIDVEGFELNVLGGLSEPLPALSVEFTTIQRDVALACLDYLDQLGDYRFNVSLGESHVMEFPALVDAAEMAEFIVALPHEANSGDIYAVLRAAPEAEPELASEDSGE